MKIERQQVYGSTLSITSAPDWDGWLTPHPCCFTHYTWRWMGHRAGLEGCGKYRFHRDSFLILSLYVIHASLSGLSWLLPFVLTLQHTQNRNLHAPGGIRTRNSNKRTAASTRLRPLGPAFKPPSPYRDAVSTELSRPTCICTGHGVTEAKSVRYALLWYLTTLSTTVTLTMSIRQQI